MVDYLTRSDWGARKPDPGPGRLDRAKVAGTAIHWPGTTSDKPITSLAAVAAALRGWQAFHMDDRGWSDIAYQVAVDQSGRAWMLRGLQTQPGANGDEAANERYGAILLILVQDEEPSELMKATTRAVIADFRRLYPGANEIKPHSAVRPDPTDCPGPAATRALEAGEFTPGHVPPTPPKPEDDMWTPEAADEIEKRYVLAHELWLAETAPERALSDAVAADLLAQGKSHAEILTQLNAIWQPAVTVKREALRKL